jgi:hypothetical protein
MPAAGSRIAAHGGRKLDFRTCHFDTSVDVPSMWPTRVMFARFYRIGLQLRFEFI